MMVAGTSADEWKPGARQIMAMLGRMMWRILAWTGFVAGGITVFLALSPVFGYLAYSDRPGPGWYGGIGWAQMPAVVAGALDFGAFFSLLFLIPATVALLATRSLERVIRRKRVRLAGGALVSGAVAGYLTMGAGWYISAGSALLVLGAALGVAAGVLVLPAAAPRRRINAAAAVTLALLSTIPMRVAYDYGDPLRVSVHHRKELDSARVQAIWRVAEQSGRFQSGGTGRDGLELSFHPRTTARERARLVNALARLPGVDSVLVDR